MGGECRPGRDRAEERFAEYLAHYWPEAVRFFRQGLYHERDRHNAEDCAQEAFIKLARRYRDDTATVRAALAHQRATDRAAVARDLARRLGCDLNEAQARAERAVASGWLRLNEAPGERAFAATTVAEESPMVLDLAPLAAMRWTTYRNVLTDYLRRRVATENRRTTDLDQLVAAGAEPRDRHPGPERSTFAATLHEQLAACLDRVGESERIVLILHYFYGFRFPALAALPAVQTIFTASTSAQPRTEAQQVQRVKDLAKAGRRQLRRRCPHLATFLTDEGDDAP